MVTSLKNKKQSWGWEVKRLLIKVRWRKEEKAQLASHSVWSCSYDVGVYLPPRGDYQEKHLLPLLTLKYSDTAWALALAFPHLSDKGVEGETPRSVNIIKSFVQQAQG